MKPLAVLYKHHVEEHVCVCISMCLCYLSPASKCLNDICYTHSSAQSAAKHQSTNQPSLDHPCLVSATFVVIQYLTQS